MNSKIVPIVTFLTVFVPLYFSDVGNGATPVVAGLAASYMGTLAYKDFLAWRIHRRNHPDEPFYGIAAVPDTEKTTDE